MDSELQSLLSHCLEAGLFEWYDSEKGGIHLVQKGVHLHIPDAHIKEFLRHSLRPKFEDDQGSWLLVPRKMGQKKKGKPPHGDNLA